MSPQLTIPDFKEIRSAASLKKLLSFINDAIEQDLIEQYWIPDGGKIGINTSETVLEVVTSGVWPDHIEWYFLWKETGAKYHLSVETYHGSGGTWERLNGESH